MRVRWIHSSADLPVWLYSEMDDEGWETRKLEIFRDGRVGFASVDECSKDTGLGEAPVPSLAEISADPQFEPYEIDAAEFERAWTARGTHWPQALA